MSLLSEAMETFHMLDKRTTTPDGYGGFIATYEEGAAFQAAATFDSSIQARIAAVQGVTSLYTITTSRAVMLEFHDVVKRDSDGMIFRITDKGKDRKTPESAALDMRQVSAEEWSLPNG